MLEIRGHFENQFSLGLISGLHAWQQVFLLTEPPHQRWLFISYIQVVFNINDENRNAFTFTLQTLNSVDA